MFNDMRLSAEMNTQFKEYQERSVNNVRTKRVYKRTHIVLTTAFQEHEFECAVTVLTSTFWPMNLSTLPKCIMPTKAMNACRAFEQFYFSRHSGRRLTWQSQMVSFESIFCVFNSYLLLTCHRVLPISRLNSRLASTLSMYPPMPCLCSCCLMTLGLMKVYL